MDLSTWYCRNRHCRYYGLPRKGSRLQFAGLQCAARRLMCPESSHWVSARTGTTYAGIQSAKMSQHPWTFPDDLAQIIWNALEYFFNH